MAQVLRVPTITVDVLLELLDPPVLVFVSSRSVLGHECQKPRVEAQKPKVERLGLRLWPATFRVLLLWVTTRTGDGDRPD